MASIFFTVFLSEALESTQYMDYGFEQAQNSLGGRGGDLHLPLACGGRRLQGACLERGPSKQVSQHINKMLYSAILTTLAPHPHHRSHPHRRLLPRIQTP